MGGRKISCTYGMPKKPQEILNVNGLVGYKNAEGQSL